MIINQTGGGKKPTGTKNITANGVYNVTDYASADVQVPTTAPAHYIEKTKNGQGVLRNAASFINLNGVTGIGDYALYGAYQQNTSLSNTDVDFGTVTSISGSNACASLFQYAHIKSLDMSSVVSISGQFACANMCSYAYVSSIDLSNLTTMSGERGMRNFISDSSVRQLDLSSLASITGAYGFLNFAQRATYLQSIDLSSLQTVSGQETMSSAFGQCSALASAIVGVKEVLNSKSCFNTTFDRCTSLTTNTVFPNLKRIYSSSNTTSGMFYQTFTRCSALTEQNFPSLEQIECTSISVYDPSYNVSPAYQTFNACTGLVTARFNVLRCTHGTNQMFTGCSALTKIAFGKSWPWAMASAACYLCKGTNVSSIDLPVVRFWGVDASFPYALSGAVKASTGITVNFPVLQGQHPDRTETCYGLSNLLSGSTNATVHFPISQQSFVESCSGYNATGTAFGATSGATILFDLVTKVNDGTNDYNRYYDGLNDTSFTYNRDRIVCANGITYYRTNEGPTQYQTFSTKEGVNVEAMEYYWVTADGQTTVRTVAEYPEAGDYVFNMVNNTNQITTVTQYVQDRVYCPKSGGQPSVGNTLYSDEACTTSVGTIATIA